MQVGYAKRKEIKSIIFTNARPSGQVGMEGGGGEGGGGGEEGAKRKWSQQTDAANLGIAYACKNLPSILVIVSPSHYTPTHYGWVDDREWQGREEAE